MTRGLWLAVALFSVAAESEAQTAVANRGFVSVNGGYQVTANDFRDGAVKRANAEDGRLDTKYTVKGGLALDVAGGGRIWRRLGIGVGVSRFSVSTPVSLTGTVPHPFFFNRLRPVSGDVAGLTREELTIHIQISGVFPIGTRSQVRVFGGPSLFRAKQGVVTDFTYTDSYPYDEAKLKAATTNAANVSKIGFNGGGDIAIFFTRQMGIGGTVQFAGTTVELPAAGGASRSAKVGGIQAGAGLRLRF